MPEQEESLRDFLDRALEDAQDMRFGVSSVPPDADPSEILESLLDVRQRLDRVEVHLIGAMTLLGSAQVTATIAEEEASDAFDAEITKQRKPANLTGDFTSAKERHAAVNLAIFDQLREARSRALDVRLLQTAVDTLRVLHRGLEGVRHDRLAALRVHQFETALDR